MQFNVVGGAFGAGFGSLYGDQLTLPKQGWGSLQLPSSSVHTVELATEERIKKLSGTIGWGAAGAIALGPIGLLAGAFLGGRKTQSTFIVTLKDERSFVATGDQKIFVALVGLASTNVHSLKSNAKDTNKIQNKEPEYLKEDLIEFAQNVSDPSVQRRFEKLCRYSNWSVSKSKKTEFEQFDVYFCSKERREIIVVFIQESVTARILNQIQHTIGTLPTTGQVYVASPGVPHSLCEGFAHSGFIVLKVDEMATTIKGWG